MSNREIVETLTFGTITDLTSATVLNAFPLVLFVFSLSALSSKFLIQKASKWFFHGHDDLEAIHQIVEILWVFSSIIALALVGWSMAVEPANKTAETWKQHIIQRQAITKAAAYEERGRFCLPSPDEKVESDSELIEYCRAVYGVISVNGELQTALEAGDFLKDYKPFPSDIAEPVINIRRFPAWISIKEYINWTNRDIIYYNLSRKEAKGATTLKTVRALWMWLYPFLGGLRVQRSVDGLFERLKRQATKNEKA